MSLSYRQRLQGRSPIVFDGALGTELQKAELIDADYQGHPGCNEILNTTRPDVISKIHREFIEAGAEIIETNTFGANRLKLAEKGVADRVAELNRAGAEVARKVADEFKAQGREVLVCGSIGPTGSLPSSKDKSLSGVSFDALAEIFAEQAGALLDGGVDLLLLETSQDLLEIRAAMVGIRRLLKARKVDIPLQVQCTMDASGRMLLGSDGKAFLAATANADAVGMNCSTGPEEMAPYIAELLHDSPLPVAMLPNAGQPENFEGKALYRLSPEAFAQGILPLVRDGGLAITGGCCGTTPGHIRELKNRLAGIEVAKRQVPERVCFCGTGLSGTDLERLARPIIIGERCNAQGSKKAKEFVLGRKWDEMMHLAVEQARRGAGLIDLCVAINERDDEAESMGALVSFLSDRIGTPLSIDTTDPAAMEAALKASPGSALLNSINLERGGERARKILAMAAEFSCPVVALTIDDQGMAKTMERKMELARKLRDLACGEFGLPEHYLYIDPLVFTLATGNAQDAGAAALSLETLRRIKEELPGVRTVMGVSNVSFGLAPAGRRVLNNLMLHHAVKQGLDAAIFNPLHIDDVDKYAPELRGVGENLLYNRTPDALPEFIRYFEEHAPAKGGQPAKTTEQAAQVALSPADKLRRAVLERDRREVAVTVAELLKTMKAAEILDSILLPAMDEVGKRMAAGTMILPFVLQAAEVMREAITILEPHLKSDAAESKGKIVLATVYGDVHDIGKNLVGSILRNQGFEVIDLGKQVDTETIVRAVEENRPDAVGLSALLVTTSREMGTCVREFARRGISIPVLIGGAAVNSSFAARISQLEDGTAYKGEVYFCRDAFEAKRIISDAKQLEAKPVKEHPIHPKAAESASASAAAPALEFGPSVEPSFYGTGPVLRWEAASLLEKIDEERLFKAWWGGGKLSEADYAKAREAEFVPMLGKLRQLIEGESLIAPAGLYGFFPVITDQEHIILLDPSDFHTELASFFFPRIHRKHNRSIADYLRPEGDLIGLQIVTIGAGLSDRVREYFTKENLYSQGYFLNGLGTYLTEELADRVTDEVTRALVLPRSSGRRYSFGYPGMPPVEGQKRLFEIMSIEERLGITLTERFQMIPEHSTLGIYIRHPEAEYLS